MNILGTGLSGLVGSYITRKLGGDFIFENLSLETGVDILDIDVVEKRFSQSNAPWVFHFAAKTNVDEAEKEKELGVKGSTWLVNVTATQIIVRACQKYHKKLLYISTDFVFAGGDYVYTEEDVPDPIGWYAHTKFEGEKRVSELKENSIILRIAFPYGSTDGPRPDFVGKIRDSLQKRITIFSPIDQIFVPTYLDDIAEGIKFLVLRNATGIYHIVGSGSISSYDASMLVARTFDLDSSLVEKTTVKKYYNNRAPRAFQLVISNAKIAELGIKPVDFLTGLKKMKGK